MENIFEKLLSEALKPDIYIEDYINKYIPILDSFIQSPDENIDRVINDEGDSMLYFSVEAGLFEYAIKLIDMGADVNFQKQGQPLFHRVLYNSIKLNKVKPKKEKVEELLLHIVEGGLDITQKDSKGLNPYELILEDWDWVREYWKVAVALVQKGADVNYKNKNGETLIIYVHDAAALKILIDNGADLNVVWKVTKGTLLHRIGDMEMVEMLIENNARLDILDERGKTAIETNPLVEKYLLSRKYGENSVLYQEKVGNDEAILKLANNGADLSETDSSGNTILHIMVKKQKKEIIKSLLHNGIDINVRNIHGKKAFENLTGNYDIQNEILNLFLEAGLDLNEIDEYGNTWLHKIEPVNDYKFEYEYAYNWNMKRSEVNSWTTLLVLLKNGVNPNKKNKQGLCPIMHFLIEGDSYAVDLLLKHGADVNTCNINGMPLLAMSLNCVEDYLRLRMFDCILKYNPRLNYRDEMGNTYLHQFINSLEKSRNAIQGLHALMLSDEEIRNDIRAMVENGIDINTKNVDGNTPLHCAYLNRENEVINILRSLNADENVVNYQGICAKNVSVYDNSVEEYCGFQGDSELNRIAGKNYYDEDEMENDPDYWDWIYSKSDN